MKLDVTTPLLAIDGTPIWSKPPVFKENPKKLNEPEMVTEGVPMILADVLINCALEPPPQGAKPYTREQHVARYEMALGAEKAKKLDPPVIEINSTTAAWIIADVERLYRTIVAGQVIPMLDGK